MGEARNKLSRAYYSARAILLLWWAGVKDALCLHRCVVFFVHDPHILVLTGQCFGLNGLIFGGSILLWDYGLAPGLRWMLQGSLQAWAGSTAVDALFFALGSIFVLCWLAPVYCISFALSCRWYQDIAVRAVRVVQANKAHQGASTVVTAPGRPGPAGRAATPPPLLLEAVAEEIYRALLFTVFFLQVTAISFVPYVGFPAYWVLVSWLYALYSFDYKWSLTNKQLLQRILFFERHWAFFAGFGSVCTLATAYWPFFMGAAVMAIIYPFFILVACDSAPLEAYKKVAAAEERAGRRLQPHALPIFAGAVASTGALLRNVQSLVLLPSYLARHRKALATAVLCIGLAAAAIRWRMGGSAGASYVTNQAPRREE